MTARRQSRSRPNPGVSAKAPRLLHPDSERGSSLLMVLIFVAAVGMIAALTLDYATDHIRLSKAVEGVTGAQNQVDAALSAAVNQVRASNYSNLSYTNGILDPCRTLPVPATEPEPDPDQDIYVTCESGSATGGIATAIQRRPARAILATGLGAASGEVGIAASGAASQFIGGGIHSNSNITTGPGGLLVGGTATAVTGCTGTISDPKDCATPAATVPTFSQPADPVSWQTVPSCPGDGTTVRFTPGFYNDAAALSALLNTCTGSTFWFPGAAGGSHFYFDFRNGETGFPAGSHVWTINNADARIVVGGATSPGSPATITMPGSCPSPLLVTDNNGASLIFGGDSRLHLSAGQLEICGPGDTPAGTPPIAVWGADADLPGATASAGPAAAPSGANNPSATTGLLTMTPDSATNAPANPNVANFGTTAAEQNKILAWDDVAVRAEINSPTPTAGTHHGVVAVSGFNPAAADPARTISAGDILTYAKLYIRHREIPTTPGDPPPTYSARVTVDPDGDAAPVVVDVALPASDDFTVTTIDLEPELQTAVRAHGFTGARVTWDVSTTLPQGLQADLDTIQLALGWQEPGFRSQSTSIGDGNCVGLPTSAYPAAGACALVRTDSTAGVAKFYVQGTGYAPRAAFDLQQTDVAGPVFEAGLIGRQVTLGLIPAPAPAGGSPTPMLSLPRTLSVAFRAYRCGEPPCTPESGPVWGAPWRLMGTAQAGYTDPGPTVSPGARGVEVSKWSMNP